MTISLQNPVEKQSLQKQKKKREEAKPVQRKLRKGSRGDNRK